MSYIIVGVICDGCGLPIDTSKTYWEGSTAPNNKPIHYHVGHAPWHDSGAVKEPRGKKAKK